jgi:autotransporter-associated beta strand protein
MWGAMCGCVGAALRLLPEAKHCVKSMLLVAALTLIAVWAALQDRAYAQSADIPLQLVPSINPDTPQSIYRLAINVGLGSSPPKTYLFDTGSSPFNAAYSPQWWPSNPPPVATMTSYCYGSGRCFNGNVVNMPSISFYASATAATPSYTLPTLSPGYQITAVTSSNIPNYSALVQNNQPIFENQFFGTFGASTFVGTGFTSPSSVVLGSVLGQSSLPGTTVGYVVAANGQQVSTDTSVPSVQKQTVTSCSPCVILGLTPSLLAQFTTKVPWSQAKSATFPNSGAPSSIETSANFNFSLSASGQPTVSWSGLTLVDSGTPFTNLNAPPSLSNAQTNPGFANVGSILSVAGGVPGAAISSETVLNNSTVSGNITYEVALNNDKQTVGIAFFLQNSVLFDLNGQVVGYTSNFVTDAPIVTPLTVSSSSVPLGLAGVISGTGGVSITAGGSATLSAVNTYTGPTVVSAGGQLFLAGPGSIAFSPVTVDGSFDISNTYSGAVIPSLSGSGTVLLGSNTLMTGSGSFSGIIADGGIAGGTGGSLIKAGNGTLTLSGINLYTGPTFVLGGTLSVNGSIASSPVLVGPRSTLGGSGTVGPTLILADGILSPGNPIGTFTVNGNLIFAAASFYLVQAQGKTADLTMVTGTATLAGTVVFSPLSGTLTRSYSGILSAAGGLSGTFDSVAAPALFTAGIGYTSNNVSLFLSSTISQISGLTRNELAVAAALDNSFNTTGVTFASLFGLSRAQLRAAMDMLSGEGVSGTQETAFGTASMFNSIMMDQGAFWRNRDTVDVNGITLGEPLSYAQTQESKADHPAFKAMPTKEPPIGDSRSRAWLTGFDGTWKLDGEAAIGSASLTHNTGGLAGGLDYQFAPDLLAGFAIGGSSSNFSVRDRITSGHLEGAHFGGYAVKTWRELYAAGAVSFSTLRNSETRSIVGVGPTQPATGSFGSNLLSARLEMGWKQAFNWFSVTPFAAVQPSQLWQNSFTETNPLPTGAIDQLGLAYGSRSVTSLPTFVGAQFDTRFAIWNGMALWPYARLSWVHEFKPDRAINASFIALPAAAFSVDGPRAASDAARADAGAKLAVAPNAWVFGSFDGEFSSRSQSYTGKGGAKITW